MLRLWIPLEYIHMSTVLYASFNLPQDKKYRASPAMMSLKLQGGKWVFLKKKTSVELNVNFA